jgi:hypothetical protein
MLIAYSINLMVGGSVHNCLFAMNSYNFHEKCLAYVEDLLENGILFS